MIKLRVTYIKDIGEYLVQFSQSGKYRINGKLVETTFDSAKKGISIGCANDVVDDIKHVTSQKVLQNYTQVSTGATIKIETYNDKLEVLLKKSTGQGNDGFPIFLDLDDEYTYKKFIRDFTPNTSIMDVETPCDVTYLTEVTLDTENPFIQSAYAIGGTSSDLYTYNRYAAIIATVKDVCTSLGLKESIAKSEADRKDFFCMSTSLQYIKVCGAYPIRKIQENIKTQRGILTDLLKCYNDDVKNITCSIKAVYALKHLEGVSVDVQELYKLFNSLKNQIFKIDSKNSTIGSQNAARKLIGDLQEVFDIMLAKNVK